METLLSLSTRSLPNNVSAALGTPPITFTPQIHFHYTEVCFVDITSIGWDYSGGSVFPVRLLHTPIWRMPFAKYEHLRFLLAKRRLILWSAASPNSLLSYQNLRVLWCASQPLSTWTLSCYYDAWLPLNGGFQKSLRVIYIARACLLDRNSEERFQSAQQFLVKRGGRR